MRSLHSHALILELIVGKIGLNYLAPEHDCLQILHTTIERLSLEDRRYATANDGTKTMLF